jgi:prepilin-type N-terminal cleavage/methylation domain-containing protein
MPVVIRRMSKLHQRGDTIVEVLIAITIISLILGGAYVTSNDSLDATQDSQEHANALQLAQAQVELLRTMATTGSPVFTTATPFCITNNGTVKTTVAACTVDSAGGVSAVPSENIYLVQIVNRTGSLTGPYTFTAQTSWPGLQNKTDHVQLIYRIYE